MSDLIDSLNFLDMVGRRSAVISDCGQYRYRLTRALGPDPRICNFVMLNPSTADATQDDRTIRRCMGFAQRWGCGLLMVSNLFAFRATEPYRLGLVADPVGPQNHDYVIGAACRARESGGLVVAAWGAHGGRDDQDRRVMSLLTETLGIPVMCLGTTVLGFPRHPLYLPKDTALVPFKHRVLKEV